MGQISDLKDQGVVKRKPLDNVCIVQKYNDSDKVMECRKAFNESKEAIERAVNCHDELVAALKCVVHGLTNGQKERKETLQSIAMEALAKAEGKK